MLDFPKIQEILQQRLSTHRLTSLKEFPHPFELENLQEACLMIKKAMQEQKQILIVGDYDADGILSSALVLHFFKALQYPHIQCVIPNRFTEGYGISVPIIQNHPSDLIITLDNGITAFEPANYCKAHQIPLIITDHHTPKSTLPDALIVNPKVSGFIQEEICGAFVAWYLCAGLKHTLQAPIDLNPFLEFVAIATISDVMPLVDLNYLALKKALKLLENPKFYFSQFLKTKHKTLTEETLGFYVAPLLNAAGRMAQAQDALDFLLSQTPQEAKERYQALKELNQQRQAIQEQITQELPQHLIQAPSCVIAYHPQWHEGVLGILAGKLSEKYQKTAFVLTQKDGLLKGSARSPQGIHLLQSLQSISSLIVEFGGHASAAGIKLKEENLQAFSQAFVPIFCDQKGKSEILGELPLDLVSLELWALLEHFAPYGEANPRPLFTSKNFRILKCRYLGKSQNHTRLTLLTPQGKCLHAMAFFQRLQPQDLQTLVFSLKAEGKTLTLLLQK